MEALLIGSLVRVVRQPENMWVHVVGERGVIQSIKNNFAEVRTYSLGKSSGGSGWVSLDCLEIDTGADLEAAHKKYLAEITVHISEGERRVRNFNTKVALVAKKYKVSEADARSIWDELQSFDTSYAPKE